MLESVPPVFARCLSAVKDERVKASKILKGPDAKYDGDAKEFVEHIRQVLAGVTKAIELLRYSVRLFTPPKLCRTHKDLCF